MSEKYSQVRYWIDDLPRLGQTTFSVREAESRFAEKTRSSVRRSLARLSEGGVIQSVWKGFYAIVLPDYGKQGIIPPADYIDQLMQYLGNGYYVGLLSAASRWGATHQAVQVFQIVSDTILHKKSKNNVSIVPVFKKRLPEKYIVTRNSRTSAVRFSSPELTALDLLLYPEESGGLNYIVTVLSEMAEELDFSKIEPDFFDGVPAAPVQRLGYLLDAILGESEKADKLYEVFVRARPRFCYAPLTPMEKTDKTACSRNRKWKVLANYQPESDI